MTFFIFLFLILGIIVAGAILVLAFPTTVEDNFKPEFKKIFDRWTADPNVNETIDFIQMELHCCGIDGSEDYTNANVRRNQNLPVLSVYEKWNNEAISIWLDIYWLVIKISILNAI